MPWAGSLWHKRAGFSNNLKLSTNESGPGWSNKARPGTTECRRWGRLPAGATTTCWQVWLGGRGKTITQQKPRGWLTPGLAQELRPPRGRMCSLSSPITTLQSRWFSDLKFYIPVRVKPNFVVIFILKYNIELNFLINTKLSEVQLLLQYKFTSISLRSDWVYHSGKVLLSLTHLNLLSLLLRPCWVLTFPANSPVVCLVLRLWCRDWEDCQTDYILKLQQSLSTSLFCGQFLHSLSLYRTHRTQSLWTTLKL